MRTLLDKRHQMGYAALSRSSRDAFARALSEAERVRCLRAGLQPAPGRLWASFPSVLRPRREVLSLDWDRIGRVTPAWLPSPRKHGLELSRDGSSCESRGRSAGRRARLRKWRAAATVIGAARAVAYINKRQRLLMLRGNGWHCAFRRFASLLGRRRSFEASWLAKLGRIDASRERCRLRVIASASEAIQMACTGIWIASSLSLLAMTRALSAPAQ